jgi:DNA processing protein
LIYPVENTILAGRIVESGAVVTEFPPGTRPEARNFPARNRLISGMSLGVVVTEAPENSGALITARYAGEQGRDVFAVPGSIYSRSSVGALALIQDGAKLVMGVTDILSELNLQMLPQTAASPKVPPEYTETRDSSAEGHLLGLLGSGGEAQHIDDLCHTSGIPIETVSAALALLELKGLVKLVGPMTYIACVPSSPPSG